MEYTAIATLSGGCKVSISETGGYVRPNPLAVLFFAQNEPVLRLEAGGGDNYVTVTFEQSSAYGGRQSYANVKFAVNSVQYLPVKSLVVNLVERLKAPYTTGVAVCGTFGMLTVQSYDIDGESTGRSDINVYMCDCGGVIQTSFVNDRMKFFPLSTNLPDTFAWFPGNYAYGYNLATVRLTNGAAQVKQLYPNGVVVKSYNGGNLYGIPVSVNWQAGVSTIATYEPDGVTVSETSRVIPVSQQGCPDGLLHVVWWSSEHGGWKSRVAEIVRPYSEITGSADYVREFDNRRAHAWRGGVLCRFSSLTLRDMVYYSDIYTSDDVRIITNRIYSGGPGVGEVRAVVRGDIPTFATRGVVDFDFYLEINNYDNI